MNGAFRFELLARDPGSAARRGLFHTPHGAFETPVFMPVATRGVLRGLTLGQLEESGAEILLGNAYHLMQRPGEAVVAGLGGLHGFMGWDKPILTDSGGFQVWSLGDLVRMDADGVTFRSEIDGRELRLTPERTMEIQNALGADIVMPLDHCLSFPATKAEAAAAVETTVRWARRCAQSHRRGDQALFPIVQGGVHADLRAECAERLVELDMPGYASGGLSVGEPRDSAAEVLAATHAILPQDRPRYLMGVGTPEDFLRAVALGVDMVDCVLPTRNARHNTALTRDGRLNLRNQRFVTDESPLDPDCSCSTCRRHSRAYLRHLATVKEMVGGTLVAVHNVHFMLDLAREARAAVSEGRFADYLRSTLKRLVPRPESPGAA